MTRQFFVGGNWKMNGNLRTMNEIAALCNLQKLSEVELVIAPSFPYLDSARKTFRSEIGIAAQNICVNDSGAFTGEVSALMLVDLNVRWVILGHSERRQIFQESSDLIGRKVAQALKHKLNVILCIGETLEQSEQGQTLQFVSDQLMQCLSHISDWSKVVIAYEPVWAIGTGKVATPEVAQETHAQIRQFIARQVSQKVAEQVRIIYGGSVTGSNSKILAKQPDIDGFLVGGASLKKEFSEIVTSNIQ